jgi:hypothetical protein
MVMEMDNENKSLEKKKLSLKAIGQEEVSLEKASPNDDHVNEEKLEHTPENIGVTVAAFMLNAETQSTEIGFGSGNTNTQGVRDEILKAIKEEEDNF